MILVLCSCVFADKCCCSNGNLYDEDSQELCIAKCATETPAGTYNMLFFRGSASDIECDAAVAQSQEAQAPEFGNYIAVALICAVIAISLYLIKKNNK